MNLMALNTPCTPSRRPVCRSEQTHWSGELRVWGKWFSCWVVDAEHLLTSTNSLVNLTLKVGGWWSGLILMAIVARFFLITQASRANM